MFFSFRKQLLQAANTDFFFNLVVPQYNEHQSLLFPLRIKPVKIGLS